MSYVMAEYQIVVDYTMISPTTSKLRSTFLGLEDDYATPTAFAAAMRSSMLGGEVRVTALAKSSMSRSAATATVSYHVAEVADVASVAAATRTAQSATRGMPAAFTAALGTKLAAPTVSASFIGVRPVPEEDPATIGRNL